MKNIEKNTTALWSRMFFLISPEDSSKGGEMLPAWATPCCCRCKALVWIALSVVGAALIGQL